MINVNIYIDMSMGSIGTGTAEMGADRSCILTNIALNAGINFNVGAGYIFQDMASPLNKFLVRCESVNRAGTEAVFTLIQSDLTDAVKSEQYKLVAENVRKSLHIQIAKEDLVRLRQQKYNLCFAKKIQGKPYNVIWKALDNMNYSATNVFEWEPQYQVFGIFTFEPNKIVKENTDLKDIYTGEVTLLDREATFSEPRKGRDFSSITAINEFNRIRFGLRQKCLFAGSSQYAAIYVGDQTDTLDKEVMTPLNTVQVWLERGVSTGMMFTSQRTNVIEVDLSGMSMVTIKYENGTWMRT